jgi:hypothetical protein
MVRTSANYIMYICKREGKLTLVLLYVDDLLLTGDSETEVQRIKSELMKQFKMLDPREVQTYLGVEIVKTKAGIWMHQRNYIKQTLDRFRLGQCNPTKISMDPRRILIKNMKSPPCNVEVYKR